LLVALALIVNVTQSLACTPIRGRGMGGHGATDGGADAGLRDAGTSLAGMNAAGGVAAAGTSGASGAGLAGGESPALGETGGSGAHGGHAAGDSAGSVAGGGGTELPDEPPPLTDPLDPNQVAFASETADADSLNLLADWSRLPVFGTGQYQQLSSHDRGQNSATEASLFPVTAHGNRDMNNFICKSADADTGTGSGLATPYQFDGAKCPETYLRGVLLARFEGSGRMTRLWMTGDALVTKSAAFSDEMLRIYVDDNPRALVQLPAQQVLTGAAGEIFTTPFGATSKSFIAWHYPIAFSHKLAVVLDHLRGQYYYQIDAVLDALAQRRVVPRQRLGQRDAAHALLAGTSPSAAAAITLHSEQLTLGAGEQRAVALDGPATIEELRLRVAKDQLSSLADVHISVLWDGATQAAIDVPILDLFAASHAVSASSSLALATSVDGDHQYLSLRLPMPFQTRADWTIDNRGSAAVNLALEWIGESQVPSSAYGHLNVQDNDVALPTTQLEQTVAQVSGRGRFVGVCADLGGHTDPALTALATNLDLLQGDFRATADGRRALDGTGTDDYADDAFYFHDSPQSTPFAQNWGRIDDTSTKPPGQVSFCRWQILGNEIDFQQDFKLIHEISQYDPAIVERHHTLAFLYLP
jgi:hypothetical protein